MATPDEFVDDIFHPNGHLRLELLNESVIEALNHAIRLARETRWDSLRSPHVFMGLLTAPDASVHNWGQRLPDTDLNSLLGQFIQDFHQDDGEEEAVLTLNREFLSDNVIALIREAIGRALDHQRSQITPMDLLICLFTTNSIVAHCLQERNGVSAARATELAVMAEHNGRGSGGHWTTQS
jgi:ATP-dependent Clp protease ATP-binding subunit ClpA